ncbi:hypothetical protein KI387_020923, partial [Taxus chinensis]
AVSIMTQVRDGTTAAKMVFIINLKMEDTHLWRFKTLTVSVIRKVQKVRLKIMLLTGSTNPEPPFGGYSESSVGGGSNSAALNSSVSAEENSYPLWYYDYNLSEYWYFDKESKAYFKYDPVLGFGKVAEGKLGGEDIFMTPNSRYLVNSEYKDNGALNFSCDNSNEKQSAIIGWPHDANILNGEPTDSTGESAVEGSTDSIHFTEDKYIDSDAVNLKEELLAEGSDPQRPSEWIEEFLINLYLKGYSNIERDVEEPLENSYSNDANIARQNDKKSLKSPSISEFSESNIRDNLYFGSHLSNERVTNSFQKASSKSSAVSCTCARKQDKEIEEGEWIPEDELDRPPSSERIENKEIDCLSSVQSEKHNVCGDNCVVETNPLNSQYECLSDGDGNLRDEEIWRAQYGQVVRCREQDNPSISALDLWEWSLVLESMRGKKGESARLVGRIAPRSKILHPSIQGGGSLLKTGSIREVYLDLVRVSSGQIYRLRCPSAKYMASLRAFNSSNPTQDWGFPPLQLTDSEKISEDFMSDSHSSNASKFCEDSTLSKPFVPNPVHEHCLTKKRQKDTWIHTRIKAYTKKELTDAELRNQRYKDRAAERRVLHGGIGFGPGQKNTNKNDLDIEQCSTTEIVESSGEEMPHYAFGVGSIARRLLEGMGWKE